MWEAGLRCLAGWPFPWEWWKRAGSHLASLWVLQEAGGKVSRGELWNSGCSSGKCPSQVEKPCTVLQAGHASSGQMETRPGVSPCLPGSQLAGPWRC